MTHDHGQAEYLTSAGAGRLLGVTPGAIRAATDRGRLKVAATASGGLRLYRREDVERYAAARTRTSRKTLG
jgi:excisionase family DNA binding protein